MVGSVVICVAACAVPLGRAAEAAGDACRSLALARAREAGDLFNQALLLPRIAELDLRAGRTGDAAAHLREGLHLAVRTGSWLDLQPALSRCGELCAATGRAAEALTLWAACAAAGQREEPADLPWFGTRWKD
jgi:hypothetical protein